MLVRDGRIADVGATIDSPADQVLDLGGLHLYPGLIALDTSLGLAEIDSVRASTDRAEVGEFSPDVQSWIAVNPDSELIPVARANGITHVQVVPGGGTVAGVSGVIALTGWTTEQMVVRKPVALHVYWPGLDLDTRPKEYVRGSSKPKPLEEQAKERAQNSNPWRISSPRPPPTPGRGRTPPTRSSSPHGKLCSRSSAGKFR